MPRVLGVIPARLHSTRLPRKLLTGIAGRPLIYWTWKQAHKSKSLDEIIIATDDTEIVDVVRSFGGQAIMTSSKHRSGTDRAAEVARRIQRASIVVNIQGDEPLISPSAIDAVVQLLRKEPKIPMATVATVFGSGEKVEDISTAKVVLDKDGRALYFSRSVIPYRRNKQPKYLKHIGLYAYRRKFLLKFASLTPTPGEMAESLEQLRALEYGYTIKVAVGQYRSIGVDTPTDLARVRRIIKK